MVNKIIKNDVIIDNDWFIITDATINEIGTENHIAIPMAAWNRMKDTISQRSTLPGLVINSDENPADFSGRIPDLSLIAVNIVTFSDGRAFSLASLLRERYGFKGDLRAKGHFIRDQLYYLKRCGFTSFEFDSPIDLETAIKSLNDFSNNYQASANQLLPLFRRRPR